MSAIRLIIVAWGIAICLSVSAGAVDPDAIPVSPDAYTTKDYDAMWYAWTRRATVEAYEKVGNHNAAWDEQAKALLEQIAKIEAERPDAPQPSELQDQARRLLATGCDDRLVLDACGWILYEAGTYEEARQASWRGVQGLTSPYSGFRRHLALYRHVNTLRKLGRTKRVRRFGHFGNESLVAALSGEEFEGEEIRILLRYVAKKYRNYSEWGKWFWEQAEQKADADPWLVHMIGGYHYREVAWEARGGGWAHTVTEEGWQGFAEGLAKAREHLTAAYEIAPHRPEAAAQMITVAMAGHADPGEGELFWFRRAAKAQFDYMPAYGKVFWALRPRWGGSHQQMYDFGLMCAATRRYDTKVPWQLVSTVEKIHWDGDVEYDFLHRPDAWEKLREVLIGYINEPTHADDRDYYLTTLAGVAWRLGRYQDARMALDQLGGDRCVRVLTEWVWMTPHKEADEVYARTGRHHVAVSNITEHVEAGNLDEAQRLAAAIEGDDEETVRTRRHLHRLISTARINEQLAGNDWVNVQPDRDLTGWCVSRGLWSIDDTGAAVGTSELDLVRRRARHTNRDQFGLRSIRLAGLFDVGQRFEFRGTVDLTSCPDPDNANGGLVFGRMDRAPRFVVTVYGKQPVVRLSVGDGMKPLKKEAPTKMVNDILVRVWDGRLKVIVNGTTAIDDLDLSERADYPYRNPLCVGLGGYASPGPLTVTYRDLSVRRLTAAHE